MIPVLFRIHGIPFHSYGLMVVVGFGVAMWWSVRECRRKGLPPQTGLEFATWALIAGIVGARLLFVLLTWKDYLYTLPSILMVNLGGLSFHGALVGGIVALLLFCWKRGLNFWLVADAFAPAALLGYPIARIGCFLKGCCYGTPTSMPWAVRFPDALHAGRLTPPSHPAQLYSSLLAFLLFLVLARLDKFVHVDGQKLCFYIAFVAIDRFVMEIFRRGVSAEVAFLGLTQAQVASIVMVVLATILYQTLERRRTARTHTCSESAEKDGVNQK